MTTGLEAMKRLYMQSATYFALPNTVAAPRERTVENMIYWDQEREEDESCKTQQQSPQNSTQ